MAGLSLAVGEIQTTEHELAAKGKLVANKIEISFVEFHTIIERCKQQLLEETRRKVRENMENLHHFCCSSPEFCGLYRAVCQALFQQCDHVHTC